MFLEDKIQAEIYKYYHNQYCLRTHNPRCLIFAVPNGGRRTGAEILKLKATGLRAGVSDLMINHFGRWVCVEVKTDIGKQSNEQKEFQQIVENLGTKYFLVRSLEDFKQKVTDF
jgi:hypothetical protein